MSGSLVVGEGGDEVCVGDASDNEVTVDGDGKNGGC